MRRNSAIRTETCEHLVLDAGVVFAGYGTTGERIIGATEGGNEFEITQEVREIELDGKFGERYKKLKRITARDASLTVNLKEITVANLKLALIGSTESSAVAGHIFGDYLGEGTTPTTGFASFTGTQKPMSGTVKINKNGARQDWTQGNQFTLTTEATNNIRIKNNLITTTEAISASYMYLTASTATHHNLIAKGTIEDAEYGLITLVAPLSGSTRNVMCYVENALAEGPVSMSHNDKEEVTMPIIFHSHWTATMEHDECPFGIKYPK